MKTVFSFQGRLSRGQYWLRLLLIIAAFAASAVCILLLGWAMARIVIDLRPAAKPPRAFIRIFAGFLFLVDLVLYSWAMLAIASRRCHDLDRSLASSFLDVKFNLAAGFARGTIGPNRFGPDPLRQAGAE